MGICCTYNKRRYSVSNMRNAQNRNIKSHNTDMYNYPGLIFRRGFPFKIEFSCSSQRSIVLKDLSVNLSISGCGEKKIILDNNYSGMENLGWRYDILSNEKNDGSITVSITSPSDAIVGRYKIYLLLRGKEIGSTVFLLFFNPFCRDDDVYMPCYDDIKEYVLNDITKIYMGTEDYIIPKEWDLGQFEPGSIESAIILLNKMPAATRSNAVDVSRQLSALINSNDDSGVLIGNWSGKYLDGTSPMAWNGSTEILSKYAQYCSPWSAVHRTIGIPSRCITNYSSLHDTDGSLKWEIYLDSNFNPISTAGDSCWY
ncbi:hypothetical protein MXB_5414 [Myxobolus squamalis]|nr:hypothetical protein MXB_5414 [Myxobolus squamalis]